MKNSPVGLRSGHRQFLFLSSSTSPCNRRNSFHCGIFNSHLSFFFPFGAIYTVGSRGLGLEVEGGGRWTVELFGSLPVSGFRSGRAWRAFCPKGNETTLAQFSDASYTHTNRNWLRLEEMAFHDSNNTGMGSFSH